MSRIALYLAPALLGAFLAGVGAWKWQAATITALEADNAALTRSVASLEESKAKTALARQVDAARAEYQRQRDAESATAVEQILTAKLGECADAPIDSDLADILDSLRRAGED